MKVVYYLKRYVLKQGHRSISLFWGIYFKDKPKYTSDMGVIESQIRNTYKSLVIVYWNWYTIQFCFFDKSDICDISDIKIVVLLLYMKRRHAHTQTPPHTHTPPKLLKQSRTLSYAVMKNLITLYLCISNEND